MSRKLIDLTGIKMCDFTDNKYGNFPKSRWSVIKRVENNNTGHVQYLCQCSCDKHTQQIVLGQTLRMGKSLSCGCLKNEKTAERNKTKFIDLTGVQMSNWHDDKYGNFPESRWRVLEEAERRSSGEHQFLCECSCNNHTRRIVTGNMLRSGKSLSCGCLNFSRGELKISSILDNNNIKYEREKTFSTCIFNNTNRLARFDFYLPDYNTLIEYDGKQHFKSENQGWDTDEHLQKTQYRDLIKNNWCKDNNMNLIRIPYTCYNKISIQDLLPETSTFLIVGSLPR